MRCSARRALRPSLLGLLCLVAWLPSLAYLGHAPAIGEVLGLQDAATNLRLSAAEWAGQQRHDASQHAEHGHGGPGAQEVAATPLALTGGLLPAPGLTATAVAAPPAALFALQHARPSLPPPR